MKMICFDTFQKNCRHQIENDCHFHQYEYTCCQEKCPIWKELGSIGNDPNEFLQDMGTAYMDEHSRL